MNSYWMAFESSSAHFNILDAMISFTHAYILFYGNNLPSCLAAVFSQVFWTNI